MAELFVLSNMTLAVETYSFGAGIHNSTIFTFDGVTSNHIEYRALFDYDINANVLWQSNPIADIDVGNLSTPNYIWYYGQSVVQVGTEVYGAFPFAFGDLKYRLLLKYSLISHSYIDLVNTYKGITNINRQTGTCVSFNRNLNVLYFLNGYISDSYNITADSWRNITDPIRMRSFAGCAMDIDYQSIFKFGGYYDVIQQYNVSNDSWIVLPATLVDDLYRLICILYEKIDDLIYCTGGYSDINKTVVGIVQVFNPRTLTIDGGLFELNIARNDHNMLLYDHCIFVLGGRDESDYLDTIEYLCLDSGMFALHT